MERIRVLKIISGFAVEGPLGGIERFAIELVRALDSAQIEPILCGLWRFHTPHEEQWVARLQAEGIEAFFAADWDESHPYHSFWHAWRGIRKHLAGRQVHLIHSHCQFGDLAALLLAPYLRARTLLRTVHNEREWPGRPGRRLLLTNVLFPLAFYLELGVSGQVTENLNSRPLARWLGRKSLTAYNAINLERFRAPHDPQALALKREELGLPAGAPVIGSVGRLTTQKGYSVFLQAARLVLGRFPSAHFVLVGTGELEEELVNLSKRLGFESAVHFTGPREDVESLLAIMDIFVSSSLWEGLPTAILESMATRTPVVATDVSGTRELVENGVTGLLVPPSDPCALADATARMLQEPEQAKMMAEHAFLHQVPRFSINEVADQYVLIYCGRAAGRSSQLDTGSAGM